VATGREKGTGAYSAEYAPVPFSLPPKRPDPREHDAQPRGIAFGAGPQGEPDQNADDKAQEAEQEQESADARLRILIDQHAHSRQEKDPQKCARKHREGPFQFHCFTFEKENCLAAWCEILRLHRTFRRHDEMSLVTKQRLLRVTAAGVAEPRTSMQRSVGRSAIRS
jgi:hypothetical protein